MLQALRDIDQAPAVLVKGAQGAATPGVVRGGPRRLGLITTLKRHFVFALLIFTAVAAAGGFVVMRRYGPVYAAEAVFHVAPMPPRILYTDAEWHNGATISFFEDYARTLTHVVRMRVVLEDAIGRLDADGVEWAYPSVERDRWVPHLRTRLTVTDILDTHLISIRMEARDPEIVKAVVEHVAGAFVDHVAKEHESLRLKQVAVLEAERDTLRDRLKSRQAELDALGDELGTPLLDDRRNVYYERILRLDLGMTKVFLRRVHAEGDYKKALGRAEDLRATVPEGEVALAMEEDRGLREARRIVSRETKARDLAATRWEEIHPRMIDMENAQDAAERAADQVERDAFNRHYARIQSAREEQAMDLIKQASRELEAARRAEERMQSVLSDAQISLRAYESGRIEGTKIRREADDAIGLLSRTTDRLEQLAIEANAPPRTQLRSPPVLPMAPVRDPRKVMGLGVLAIAAVLALLGALLAESRWPKLLDAHDAARWGLPVFADLTHRSKHTAATDLALRLRRNPDRAISMVPATRAAAKVTQNGTEALQAQVSSTAEAGLAPAAVDVRATDVAADSPDALHEGATGRSALIWIPGRGASARHVLDVAARWEAVGGKVLGTVFGGEKVRSA